MIARKKEFTIGLTLLIGFFVVLAIFFSPVFNGQNGLDYLDNLYNSISKGSAYYIPKVREEVKPFAGTAVALTLGMESPEQAKQTAALYAKAGAQASPEGATVKVSGDLAKVLEGCLADSDAMYANDGKKIADKYGFNERQAQYNWWKSLKSAEKDLQGQKKFKEAKVIASVNKKVVETAYNYYRIEPQKIGDQVWLVIGSLVFYVVYTLWYGFAILYLFEGWGMQLEH